MIFTGVITMGNMQVASRKALIGGRGRDEILSVG